MKGKVKVELEGNVYQLQYYLYSDGEYCLPSGSNGTGELSLTDLATLQANHSTEILLAIHNHEKGTPYDQP